MVSQVYFKVGNHSHFPVNVIFLKLAGEVALWEGWAGGWPANEEGWMLGCGAGSVAAT